MKGIKFLLVFHLALLLPLARPSLVRRMSTHKVVTVGEAVAVAFYGKNAMLEAFWNKVLKVF
jgi:hypothetical protein